LFDCIILGDSIAIGLGQARPDCTVEAVSGITSGRYVQTFASTAHARIAVISLGVNDGDGEATAAHLGRLRSLVSANVVYWLVTGGNPRARDAVREIASRFGDRLIDAAPLAGPDQIHPDRAGYARLAQEIGRRGPGTPFASAYRDFASPARIYRAFPGLTVWSGPYRVTIAPTSATPRP
jgi:hypothetical protein